ncbi:MAG: hypothetical protein WC378_09095 [Opitutaceae bacterium]|jgi:hypothetical protein
MPRRTTYNASTAPLPLLLNTPEFRAAWADWCADRADRGHPLTARAATISLNRCEPLGPAAAVAAIEHSIAAGYQGIYEDPTFSKRLKTTLSPAQIQPRQEPDWVAERRQREAEAELRALRKELYDLIRPGGFECPLSDLGSSRQARYHALRKQIAALKKQLCKETE